MSTHKKSKDKCLLCLNVAYLQHSHVVPKFVFRWLKKVSLSGTLRSGQTPNRRSQDGLKRYWLCKDCETTLSKWETIFANTVFQPILLNDQSVISYSSWMSLFCASLCWRTLKLALLEVECNFLKPERHLLANEALCLWKAYMLGRVAEVGKFELHFIPLNKSHLIKESREYHPFFFRYLSLGVDAEILEDRDNLMVYVKLPDMVILGMIQPESIAGWEDTKIHCKTGTIDPFNYNLPKVFYDFMNYRANYLSSMCIELSQNQNNKITDVLEADLEITAQSPYIKALKQDIAASGISSALPFSNKTKDV